MIAQLTGTVADVRLAHIVLAVQGVGYQLALPTRDIPNVRAGQQVSLHTYLAVRENALDLYGFLTQDDREMFEHLIGLPKIGPKTALGILSQAETTLIRNAAIQNDATYLSKMSGIGKKTAEKIVVGLKDVFEGEAIDSTGTEGAGGVGDIIDTLVALGYSERDARSAAQQIPETITDTSERIKAALKLLSV